MLVRIYILYVYIYINNVWLKPNQIAKIIKQHESEKGGTRNRNAQYLELEECLSMWHQQMINLLLILNREKTKLKIDYIRLLSNLII